MATLLKSISSTDSVLMIADTADLPTVDGVIQLDSEIVSYTTHYMGTLYGCLRGQESTSAAAHSAGTPIVLTDFYTPLNSVTTLAAGSSTVPSLAFAQDAGTGLYLVPATTAVTWVTFLNTSDMYTIEQGAPGSFILTINGTENYTSTTDWTIFPGDSASTAASLAQAVTNRPSAFVTAGTGSNTTDLFAIAPGTAGNSITYSITLDNGDWTLTPLVAAGTDAAVGISAAAQPAAVVTSDVVAGDMRFMLWDVSAGMLVQVSRGDADSGGTGFRLLRVPN